MLNPRLKIGTMTGELGLWEGVRLCNPSWAGAVAPERIAVVLRHADTQFQR